MTEPAAPPHRFRYMVLGAAALGVAMIAWQIGTAHRGGGAAGLGSPSESGMDLMHTWAASSTPAAGAGYAAPPVSAGQAPDGTLIVTAVRLHIVSADFEAAQSGLHRLVTEAGGVISVLSTQSERRQPRSLEAMLRVPAQRLEDTLARIRALGHVSREDGETEDVTRQSADLDSRLTNARTSEMRLRELLQRRTGTLADVLAVERELTRVRQEIESMEAQRKTLDRRIAFAAVSLALTEERTAAFDIGATPLRRRVRNAAVDGWALGLQLAVNTVLFVIWVFPALVLLSVIILPPAVLLRRRLRRTG